MQHLVSIRREEDVADEEVLKMHMMSAQIMGGMH